ncbi:MAG TPA: hypothetical protein VJ913_12260 [Actinomycetota bacterium]|nr:hypothetical protein [Actinomycetota bacterium]
MTRPPSAATVSFADADPNGLADLVGRLIASNLERDPDRRRLLRSAVVELSASDADIQATIHVDAAGVSVANGPASSKPHLRVRADAFDLIELAAAPLRLGLPDVFDARGRAVLGRIAGRHVRVSGMLAHPLRLTRFTRLLSVGAVP